MKKETSDFKAQELRALAAQKIAGLAGNKNVVTAEPEQDELKTGERVFLFRGRETGTQMVKASKSL
jgi:hypothetical protein